MALLELSFWSFVWLGFGGLLLHILLTSLYNLTVHPLSAYPGPVLFGCTRLPLTYRLLTGTLPSHILALHKRYGPVVRIAPDELSFADAAAWKDIMGHRPAGVEGFEKNPKFYRPFDFLPIDIVNAEREEHALLRRTMAHGFSERNMRAQLELVRGYVDLLVGKLRERGESTNGVEGEKGERGEGKKVDMAAWYNYTTFDIIGDLAFGESFGCLENSDYHPWVKAIFQLARAGTVFQCLAQYPGVMRLVLALMPGWLMKKREEHMALTRAKLSRRMEAGKERPDLVEGLLQKREEWGLTMEKLQANSSILIIGGSETTATLLSGVTFLLLTNRPALERLTAEIRVKFTSEDEIDFVSVNALSYLFACLEEALRMYPPVPMGLPRVAPKGGATIAGHFVPEKTIVAVHQWAMYHNDAHFKDPFSFRPERWLGDPEFANDHKEALQPFHIGPRNCLGRNLAYLEMRIILARVLWNFDMRIAEQSLDWMGKQRVFNFWEKGPLYVHLTSVR